MILDNELPIGAGSINPLAQKEMSFTKATKLNFHNNMLTDTPYSEAMQYNETIYEILGEDADVPAPVGVTTMNRSTIELLDKQWDEGYYGVDDKGNIYNTEKSKGMSIFETKFMASDTHVKTWLALKSKGFTASTINEMVLKKTQDTYKKNRQDLAYYDDNNNWGSSGLASFAGGTASWIADPINLVGLALEMYVFKGSNVQGGFLREGASNVLFNINDKNVNKLIAKQVNKYGAKALLEFKDYKKVLQAAKLSSEEMTKKFIAKKDWKNPNTKKMITDAMRLARTKEMLKFAGVSGGIGAATELGHQAGTLDWKSTVHSGENNMPNYQEEQAKNDIKLAAGFGFVFGGVFNLASNILFPKKTFGIATSGVDEIAGIKSASDIEDNIPAAGIDEVEQIDMSKVDIEDIVDNIDYDDIALDDDILRTKVELDDWDKISNCYHQSINN